MKLKLHITAVLTAYLAVVSAAFASEWYGADGNGTATAGNWSSDGKPGWNGTGVPNGQGAVAYFGSTKKNNVSFDGDYTVGSLILDHQAKNLDLSLNGTGVLSFDSGNSCSVISNNAPYSRIMFGSNVKAHVAGGLEVVNVTQDEFATQARTMSIGMKTITGSGSITIDNAIDNPSYNHGTIQFVGSSASTFEGPVLIRRGCIQAKDSKPFGNVANIVTLGAEGYGDATLCFEGTSMTFSNPLVVSKVTNGRLRIYGESISKPSSSGSYAVSLTGGATLNGDVVFDIPSHAYNDGAIVCPFTETVDSVISGVGGVTKENNGMLVFKKVNTYEGGTVLKAGTLSLTSGATLGTGGLDVYDGATLDLASDVTVASVRLNGKMQQKGTYAALDSSAGGAVVKVPWISGAGLVRALDGKSGMAIIIR